MKLYYISDTAYDKLWRMAMHSNYIKSGAAYGRGLSEYLNTLSYFDFTDQRPDEYKQSDAARRKLNLTLYWSQGLVRRPRGLRLDESAVENYCALALRFRIGIGLSAKGEHVVLRSDVVTIAQVLEAIGLGWLVPSELPIEKVKIPPPSRRGVRV